MLRRFALLLLVTVALPLAACSSGEAEQRDVIPFLEERPAATATVAPPPTPTPVPVLAPDGERIKALVHQLSVNIGSRVMGTSGEIEGANLVADLLRSHGYEVEIQEFSVSRQTARESSISVTSPTLRAVASNPLTNSVSARVSGPVVFGGLGRLEDIPASAKGAILLLERGELTFQQKVENAQAAGAAGLIIANNEAGNFFGALASGSRIPAVSISQAEGRALRSELSRPVEVQIEVGEAPVANSRNVIARPPGAKCETITGGHMDSVPQSPGANDNASGTATVVEIAAVMASQGKMGANCFILFGGEEYGLLGSKHYVETLSAEDRQRIKAMLNFDMVGFGSEPWYLIGTPSMQTRASDIARQLGIEAQNRGGAGTGASSDHASFINAGIPSIFFYRANDPQWHQPGDTADRLSPQLLEEAARMGVALLEALRGG